MPPPPSLLDYSNYALAFFGIHNNIQNHLINKKTTVILPVGFRGEKIMPVCVLLAIAWCMSHCQESVKYLFL